MKTRLVRSALLLLPAILLNACGGGGGGGDGGSAAGGSSVAGVVITSSNAKAVAADALENSTDGSTAGTGASLITGVQVDSGSSGGPLQLASASRTLLGLVPAMPSQATGVAVNRTVLCASGGSLQISGNLSGGSSIVAGDTLTIAAAGCKEMVDGKLTTMNGSLAFRFESGSSFTSASSYPYRIVMTFTATNFAISQGTETTTSNGDLRIDLLASSPTSSDITLTGSSLASSHASTSGTRSATLKNYTETVAVRGSTQTSSITATVVSTNSRLGSSAVSYTITTVTPLTSTTSGDVTSGVIKVTGSGSALLLTVTGTNTFKVETDANGDGTYESSTTATKSELEALL
jgi:hypothetical protein